MTTKNKQSCTKLKSSEATPQCSGGGVYDIITFITSDTRVYIEHYGNTALLITIRYCAKRVKLCRHAPRYPSSQPPAKSACIAPSAVDIFVIRKLNFILKISIILI